MLSKRVLSLKPSAVMALSNRAKKLRDQGVDVISLSIGEPTWDTYKPFCTAAISAIQEGYTKYTPSGGSLKVKQTLMEYSKNQFNMDFKPSEVFVTSGSKFAIFCALQSLLDPEDEVLLPVPYWVSYPSMVELSGAKLRTVETVKEDGFQLNPTRLEEAISEKSKVLIINSPNNPTGAVIPTDRLEAIAKILLKYPKIFILTDDIYNELYFSGPLSPHILQVCPELRDRVVAINAVSKNYSMPGWRLGWAVGLEPVISAMSRYQSQTISCASSIAQEAVARALLNCQDELKGIQTHLLELRNFSVDQFKSVEGFDVFPPEGAFYIWIDVKKWVNTSFKGKLITSSKDFVDMLFQDQSVLLAPGEAFGCPGYVRVHFGESKSKIQSATERMRAFVSSLK